MINQNISVVNPVFRKLERPESAASTPIPGINRRTYGDLIIAFILSISGLEGHQILLPRGAKRSLNKCFLVTFAVLLNRQLNSRLPRGNISCDLKVFPFKIGHLDNYQINDKTIKSMQFYAT